MKARKSRSKNRKFRRTGRHTAPSQTQKVALAAGKAAPAVAVVGALAAAPQTAFASTTAPAAAAGHATPATQGHRVTRAHLDAATHPGRQAARTYTVRTGDTLSGIAQQFYGHASDWQWLYHINRAKISDPNLIYTGQVFSAPANPPASVRNGTYQGRHAKSVAASSTADSQPSASPASSSSGGSSSGGSSGSGAPATNVAAGHGVSCSGSAGGMVPANYAAIVNFLTSHGYTGNAAAGIAGNIWQESGGNPESVGSGGGGLIGWTPLPGGYVTGNYAADLQTQLAAILTFNQIWSQYIPALNAASSPAAAAAIYVTDFERAGIPAVGNREAAAQAVASACGI
ncbi:MAG: peptidoglycan-binding protein LysM [Actinomycetia bacterium]|nr:peptidoglycan-binding protein LysM [Actinomycetes bacterium]